MSSHIRRRMTSYLLSRRFALDFVIRAEGCRPQKSYFRCRHAGWLFLNLAVRFADAYVLVISRLDRITQWDSADARP